MRLRTSPGGIIVFALLLVGTAARVHGQECYYKGCSSTYGPSPLAYFEQHAISLGVTAVVGGLTAGIRQAIEGESFWRAFQTGALGGAVGYAGKRVSGLRFSGSGFVGRELSAIGASMVLNASEGRGTFDRLILPIGWVWLEVSPEEADPLELKLDVSAVVATTYLLSNGSSMDWRWTLRAGAPVLIADSEELSRGRHVAGVIELRRDFADWMNSVLVHEQVHVAQSDFASIIWSVPLEGAVLSGIGVPAGIADRLHFGAHHLIRAGVTSTVSYDRDPWEWEAKLLSGDHY